MAKSTRRPRSQTKRQLMGSIQRTDMDTSEGQLAGAEEECHFGKIEKKNVITKVDNAMPACTSQFYRHQGNSDPWDTPFQNPTLTHLTQQMSKMQDQMERLMIANVGNPRQHLSQYPSPINFHSLRHHPSNLQYPSTASVPTANQRQIPIVTVSQITQIEDAYKSDARTLHEIKILKSILQAPEEAEQIASKRLRYLTKTSLLGWRAAEDLPSLAEVAMLTPQEAETLQRKQLESVVKPPLPPAFQQNKPLTATNVKIPITDRMGKPIRNPSAYLNAMMKNSKN